MENEYPLSCAICGERKRDHERWFLVADNRWQDKLRILQWNDQVARQLGMFHVCSAEHVQELVVHWMTTGSLNYPFAFVPSSAKTVPFRHPLRQNQPAAPSEVETAEARQIGELAVHRDSMLRILNDSPHSLTAILEALLSALRKHSPRSFVESEIADESCSVLQEV